MTEASNSPTSSPSSERAELEPPSYQSCILKTHSPSGCMGQFWNNGKCHRMLELVGGEMGSTLVLLWLEKGRKVPCLSQVDWSP